MQEINLLQNKLKDTTNNWEKNNRVIVILLSLVLVAVLGVTGLFYMLKTSALEAKSDLDQQNLNIQKSLDQMEGRLAKAKGFQAQSKNIATLMNSHTVWTGVMDDLINRTYKNSRYFSVTGDTSGSLHIEGLTADYVNLGKLLLALETSKDFTDVKLLSTAPAYGELAGKIFSIEVTVNQEAFLKK